MFDLDLNSIYFHSDYRIFAGDSFGDDVKEETDDASFELDDTLKVQKPRPSRGRGKYNERSIYLP